MAAKSALSFLFCKVESATDRFICFTKLVEKDILVISVTNGVQLWQIDLDSEDLQSYSSLAGLDSAEKYLDIIKESIEKSDVNVALLPQKLMLHFGSKPGSLALELFEAACHQMKDSMQELIFKLADNVKTLKSELCSANLKIKQKEDTSKTKSPHTSPFKNDLVSKRAKTTPKRKQLKGSSVINPGTKRRKAAQGVLFE